MNGRTMANNEGMGMEGEPGATDSELTLSQAEHPFIADWEDGQTYKLTVEVTQLAPGRFRVDTASAAATSEDEGPAEEAAAGVSEPTNSADYENPAVAKMMSRARA